MSEKILTQNKDQKVLSEKTQKIETELEKNFSYILQLLSDKSKWGIVD